ncbi:WXG100 family type VII secretion target [Streptomyces albidoflavus]|jgi:uncharacterized protein YukE|uniref:WXG100 family type VII secretion target n=1 Tax=Streptomyces odorifer TaxID=53450 RepID=A0A7Y6CB97_9ACTN|nr:MULTISPECIES: WXG100 family type VII secretion target [Streptomyces]MBZ2409050.1 WXG100 family type VII secretion target [Streptomyces sp. L06]NUV36496.1 hypothetical protein [Streptomyces sp. KAI-27]NUV49432.1 hypothetical protein [Streptomyces sp. CAI-78]MBL0775987.1 WXG100 family type VII secretion target [Streptomyces albidoflavus]MBL0799117.1 WXG100 family type VII secretion target [Streptomyces albidoflavus]
MADPQIEELTQRAQRLRSLADHIDSLVDQPKRHSTTQMKSWSGPNADAVRGKLRTWHTTCTNVAKSLRDEAQQCTNDAKDLKKDDKK